MNPLVSLYSRTVVAGAFALVIPLAGNAADNAPPEALYVKVFPDRYVAAGKPFADVAALAAWAKPIVIRTLWLDTCGSASTKQLLAAVERFQSTYPDGIQIRALSADEAGCASTANSETSSVTDGKSARVDAAYFATDESGHSMLP
jgi:hypothetical protein